MDPASAFGVAASVAPFAYLAVNVSLVLSEYFQKVKQAPKLSLELQQEACLVSLVVRELGSTLGTINNPRTMIGLPGALSDTVEEFSKTVTEMESRIAIQDGGLIKRPRWPFTEKETTTYLSRLEKYKRTFTLALITIQRYIFNFIPKETNVSSKPTSTTD
jgi:hypothetical protein